ncbi:8421_t:CDS:10 [Diversispora eburnea]|uniref:8421_t:CDS:1 n=2 Tax=Diversisporales TaxID=214509 RepID=A0A9N8W670_9GLOM|nr:8421_t:CDS:10 [Diversispora eburnea]
MVLQVSNPNDVKIYTVSGTGSRAIPDWLARKKRRMLKDDPEWRSRIELIQDFEFPEASIRVKTTKDGKFVMATGVYKPQIRVFEFSEMSMKFDRHTDSENVDFEILSDDWTKDLAYHYPTCDLLITSSSHEVYRLNLCQGRFLNPISTDATSGVNVGIINPVHQLYGFGTEDGRVEFWDPRSRSRVGVLTPSFPDEPDNQSLSITSMEYKNDGLSLAIGTSTGHILLYDLRSSNPWLVKDHQYGYPIKSIKWYYDDVTGDKGQNKIISADCKIIKIWDKDNGSHFTSVEPITDINDICLVQDSGLIFVANEGIQIGAYYIPALGPAPKWCSFLDNLTEEMEENPQQNIYDDYKFITRKELENLGMDHLIGTNVLRPYMHGFFIDLRLHEQAKAIANPFAYVDYREKIIKERLEKERESRIRATKKLPKVNKELAGRLLNLSNKKKSNKEAVDPLKDTRFGELFSNPDFEIDKNSIEYKLLHPTLTSKFAQESGNSKTSESSETDSDEDLITQVNKQRRIKKIEDDHIRTAHSGNQKQKKIEMKIGRIVGSSKDRKNKEITGNMEMSFKIKNKFNKQSLDDNDSRKKSQRRNRRPASKNVLRGLG